MIPWVPSDDALLSAVREGHDTVRDLAETFASGLTSAENHRFKVKIRRKLVSLERFGLVARAGIPARVGIDRQRWRAVE